MPFNVGTRIRLGQRFTVNEVGYVVMRLLQELEGARAVKVEEG